MLNKVVSAAAMAAMFIASVAACKSSASDKKAVPAAAANPVARGAYLVNGMGCDDCHSPKRMGPRGPEVIAELRFSGYPASRPIQQPDGGDLKKGFVLMGPDNTSSVGPWGTSFAANISGDATGIGGWTEAQFLTAMKEGKSKGIAANRMLLPPMPWTVYRNLSDDDLKAIFAFLKASPAVRNVVPAPLPPGS